MAQGLRVCWPAKPGAENKERSESTVESALRNRRAPGSAPESALEGASRES